MSKSPLLRVLFLKLKKKTNTACKSCFVDTLLDIYNVNNFFYFYKTGNQSGGALHGYSNNMQYSASLKFLKINARCSRDIKEPRSSI